MGDFNEGDFFRNIQMLADSDDDDELKVQKIARLIMQLDTKIESAANSRNINQLHKLKNALERLSRYENWLIQKAMKDNMQLIQAIERALGAPAGVK